ncbi:MAG: hypothetical protein RIR26_2842 [Pseudomonadota bacterium]|jgi:uncharacterized coiled-coil protein SlyX
MRLSANVNLFFTVLCLSFAFAGCSALETVGKVEKSTAEVGNKMDDTNRSIDDTNRKMDETNRSIAETNQKMDEMKRSMGEMNDKLVDTNKRIENMNRALDRMYRDLRQGDALAARLQTLEKLSAAPALKGKTAFAAQYFMSFEYQLWKGEGSDTPEFRALLVRDAVDEFIQTVRGYSSDRLDISPMTEDGRLLCLQALALASHMVNSNGAFFLKNRGETVLSMHSLLKEALLWGEKLAEGKTLLKEMPPFAQLALREPELVKYVFEMRINMLPALMLSEISGVGSDEFVGKWVSRAGAWLTPWTATLDKKNEMELLEFTEWLSWAADDLQFLSKLELHPRVDGALIKVLRNMRFTDEAVQEGKASDQRAGLVSELKQRLDTFLSLVP